ncbi:MAG: ATP-binding protein [bacterium]|jgi:hypothetical protein
MFNKPLANLTIEDIEELIIKEVPESNTLDYKEEIYPLNDDGKSEFLRDVCAFANSEGGLIIIGIKEIRLENGEPTGLPEAVVPVDITNLERHIQTWTDLPKNSVEPPISSHSVTVIKSIESDGFGVVVISIPRSYRPPHATRKPHGGQWYRFSKRLLRRSQSLDLDGIREQFIHERSFRQSLEHSRSERLNKILRGENCVMSRYAPKLVLHIWPQNFPTYIKDLQSDDLFREITRRIDLSEAQWSRDFDGRCVYTQTSHPDFTYSMMFFSGLFELVLCMDVHRTASGNELHLNANETEIVEGWQEIMQVLEMLNLEFPVYIGFSLLLVDNHIIFTPPAISPRIMTQLGRKRLCRRNTLVAPIFELPEPQADCMSSIQQIMNRFYNEFGLARSINQISESQGS